MAQEEVATPKSLAEIAADLEDDGQLNDSIPACGIDLSQAAKPASHTTREEMSKLQEDPCAALSEHQVKIQELINHIQQGYAPQTADVRSIAEAVNSLLILILSRGIK